MEPRVPSLLILALLTASTAAQQPTWSKYIPKNQRNGIIKKTVRVTGLGASMTGHGTSIAIWATEPTARALVSEIVERERLTPEEADRHLADLRVQNYYCFLINVLERPPSLFTGRRGSGKPSPIGNPLKHREVFLQRAEDRDQFSKGTVSDHEFDFYLNAPTLPETAYLVFLPKLARNGHPIVRSLSDKIELQFTISGKKVVLDFKIKDIVGSIEKL
ncbi:MAG: hypothetical protein AABN33_27885 [Acidobacteriota bacterium]